jgi:hypothetical protein
MYAMSACNKPFAPNTACRHVLNRPRTAGSKDGHSKPVAIAITIIITITITIPITIATQLFQATDNPE